MNGNGSLTGKIGHRVVKPWLRKPYLVIQVEQDVDIMRGSGIPGDDIEFETHQQWRDASFIALNNCLEYPQAKDFRSAIEQRAASPGTLPDRPDLSLAPILTGKIGFRLVAPCWRSPLLVTQVEVVCKTVTGATRAPGHRRIQTRSEWRDATINSLNECLQIQREKEQDHG